MEADRNKTGDERLTRKA
jgi:hypothetical protein